MLHAGIINIICIMKGLAELSVKKVMRHTANAEQAGEKHDFFRFACFCSAKISFYAVFFLLLHPR